MRQSSGHPARVIPDDLDMTGEVPVLLSGYVVIFGPHGVTVHPLNAFMGGNRDITIPAV